jgi:hypothetical protein
LNPHHENSHLKALPDTWLSIASAAGMNTVSWTADSSWELTGAANVAGPYAPQAGVSPFSFAVPTGGTNRFYRLRYTGRP